METETSQALNFDVEFEVAKAAILDEEGRLLILWRNDDDNHRPGGADFPGGGVDPGENVETAIIREAKEEAGLDLAEAVMSRVCKITTYEDGETGVKKIQRTFFVAYMENPQVALGDEHKGYDWKAISEAEVDLRDSLPKLLCVDGIKRLHKMNHLPITS